MARSAKVLAATKDMPTRLSQAYSKQFPSAAKSKMGNLQSAAQRRLGGAPRMQQAPKSPQLSKASTTPPKKTSTAPPKQQEQARQADKMKQLQQKVKMSAGQSPRTKKSQGNAQLKSQLGSMGFGKK